MMWKDLPTPCYVADEKKLKENLRILQKLEKDTGCHVLLAQKAFSMFSLYPMIGTFISGTTASGLYEARLGREEMGKENHVFAPAYKEADMKELVKATEGFSGAEIEEVVNEALFNAYANGQDEVRMENLSECIAATSPLSRTMAETIANLRKWAEQRARLASKDKPEDVKDLGEDVPRLQQEYKNPFISKKGRA